VEGAAHDRLVEDLLEEGELAAAGGGVAQGNAVDGAVVLDDDVRAVAAGLELREVAVLVEDRRELRDLPAKIPAVRRRASATRRAPRRAKTRSTTSGSSSAR
jgi:hypothetical protein